jgi:hypothetical protein
LATRIRVRMKNGQELSASTDLHSGQIFKNPITEENIISKSRNNIAHSGKVSAEKAEKSLEMILNLEKIKT